MKSIQRDGDVSEKEMWKSLMNEKKKAAKDSWGIYLGHYYWFCAIKKIKSADDYVSAFLSNITVHKW